VCARNWVRGSASRTTESQNRTPQSCGSLALSDINLYRVSENSKEGFGLFGQFGISDGNPSRLYWSALVGIGGTGLIPGRSRDNWGIGYYYDAPSRDLQDSLSPVLTIRDEQGVEIFYNFAVTPWFTVGVDLQVINPSLGEDTAILPGLRCVTRF
jgi:porin